MTDSFYKPRILLIRLSALGDVIQTLPVVSAIRQKYPQAYISWVTDEDFADYLRAVPEIDQVIAIPRKGWLQMLFSPFKWKRLFQEIKKFQQQVQEQNYEIGIDMQGLLKSALLLYLTGLKRRVGFNHWREWTGLFYTEKYVSHKEYFNPEIYHIKHMFSLLKSLGCAFYAPENIRFALATLSQEIHSSVDARLSFFNRSYSLVGIVLGTQWESKLWPLGHWEELVCKILSQANCSVVLLGGKADSRKSEELMKRVLNALPNASGRILNLAGKTDLFELQALLGKLQIVIGSDTAPVHLAAAVETPFVIGLFGPTASLRTSPIGPKRIQVLRTQLALSCLPCHQRSCKIQERNLCMNSVSPDEVYELLKVFLERNLDLS